jgi:hypothetical protein
MKINQRKEQLSDRNLLRIQTKPPIAPVETKNQAKIEDSSKNKFHSVLACVMMSLTPTERNCPMGGQRKPLYFSQV